MLISSSTFFLSYTSPIILAVFIISLALTHTFLDSIPSIFLGAPDPDMALSVLPGHRLLLGGKGLLAIKLTVIGSLFCLLITLILIPLLIPILPSLYAFLQPWIGHILVAVVISMIWMEKKKFIGFYIFLQSGVLGLIVLNLPILSQPLFPMLSGLFGISTLLLSLQNKNAVPPQDKKSIVVLPKKESAKAIAAGVFSGTLTGLFPGLGAAQASIIGSQLVRNISPYAFLMLIGGINTVNFTFSLATLFALDKARNGAIVAVKELVTSITSSDLLLFITVALIVGGIASILAIVIARGFTKLIRKINYRKLVISIIAFITFLVIILTGWIGLLVLMVSSAIGLLPPLLGVKRSHNMGCLLLPVILFFLV